ncbi:DegV family protein [Oscillospiraceae bacterium MB08-C2-2]|nr:DegV family protein [Oscillospiraceae bacterium MB08-C2-2]
MNNTFKLVTDSSCDLPLDYLAENDIGSVELLYTIGGKEYAAYDAAMPIGTLYQRMRDGEMPQTAQVNVESMRSFFENILTQGLDVLYLGFSSGLSGTCQSGQIAAKELAAEYPQRKIIVVDTLCASLGQGLLVHLANQKKQQGMSIEEVAQWAEDTKLHLVHVFTVDDLMHLHRGGRVSKASAIMGSMLGIKPILHVDNAGRLIPIHKVRGRRQSLNYLVEYAAANMGQWHNEVFFISHGDCLEEAQYVAKVMEEKTGIKPGIIDYVGSVIGTHSGPGTMALFILGNQR